MIKPKKPANEPERLAALERYDILDTLPEQAYDDIVAIASSICQVPIALVSLVDDDRQWFKARVGLDAHETGRDISFCGHVVETSQRIVVENALQDERFADNPLVVGDPNIRFYLGTPLETSDGFTLGTLCVIDDQPRKLTSEQTDLLERLARLVVEQMEARLETQRRTAAEHLQRGFFELNLDMLCIAGADGYFKQLNPAWTATLGFSVEELMARPFIEFVHPDDREPTIQKAQALTRNEDVVWFENRYRHRAGGYRWLAWSAAFDRQNQVILAGARDITEQKEHASSLEQARIAAEAANKAKSEFLAQMSHELRTPLNSVIGFSSILAKNKAGNLRDKDLLYLDRIRGNGRHLLALIDDVLDLSKVEAGEMTAFCEPVDVGRLVEETCADLQGAVTAKGNALRVDGPPSLRPVKADPRLLRQVLVNLIGNANKFTQDGRIEVRIVPSDDARPARIDVSDDGIGIPPEKLEEIFRAFRQASEGTSREYGGTGLGLAISRAVCELQGFSLTAASQPGEGSTFSLLIDPSSSQPQHIPPDTTPRFPRPTEENPQIRHEGKQSVLIIDDDSDSRLILADHVEELGARVVTADSGEDGLRIAEAIQPDLILLDLQLPDIHGREVLARIAAHAELKRIPVIVCSSASPRTLEGTRAILDKPVDKDSLLGMLQAELESLTKVLVVEDDAGTAMLIRRLLEDLGTQVLTAADGEEGLALAATERPDLIVLDICLPKLDGFGFLQRLHRDEQVADTPVIACTAADLSPADEHKLRCSCEQLIRKDGQLSVSLTEVVKRVLSQSAEQSR